MRHFFSDRAPRARKGLQHSSLLAVAALLLVALVAPAHAATPEPVRTELTVTHIAPDKWRADYVFAEPVTAVALGHKIGAYRTQSWRPLTPGVVLMADGDNEMLRSASALTRLSVEIGAYDEYAEGYYVPISRYSDGGVDFYLGFLYGALVQDGRERAMDVALQLRGLPGETVMAPARPGTELAGFAYFGPRQPARMGNVDVIIDPQAPAWLRAVIDETTAKVSRFYAQAFGRALSDRPLVSVAIVGFDGAPGNISIKGGVVGGGIAYRAEGAGLVEDHPQKRALVARLVAHEMAHLWQVNLARGGIGGDEGWVHEGGAEAIMLEALRATGIFSEQASDAYAQALVEECARLKDDVTVDRGLYACGFKRFHGYAMKPLPLWRALMARSEASGAFYSESMIRGVLEQ